MKKVLYSTTALVAAGMFAFSGADAQAAEKVKLGISGAFIWVGGVSDNDSEATKDLAAFNSVTDSEISFSGNTTLDNGVRVDVILQLETDQVTANSSGVSVDESYIKLGNMKQWGEFRLGSTKQAHFVFKVNAPAVNTINNALNPDTSNRFVPSKSGTNFYNHAGGADHQKIVYITPKLNGFQGGISYTPSSTNSDGPPKTNGAMASESENVSIGANWKGKFGDASVAISGGWTGTSGKKGVGSEHTVTQFGGSVGFAGFTIGGGWAQREDDDAMMTNDDIEGYMAGVGYKTGPWSLALTWLNTTDDQTDMPGEDESNQYTLGMAYSLGAGVTAGASLFQISHEDEDTNNKMTNNEGWGTLAGIKVAF